MNGIQVVTGGLQRALRPTNIHRLEEIMCVHVCVCACVCVCVYLQVLQFIWSIWCIDMNPAFSWQ